MLEVGKVGQWEVMGWTRQSDNSGVGNYLYRGPSRLKAICTLIKYSYTFDRISINLFNKSWPHK